MTAIAHRAFTEAACEELLASLPSPVLMLPALQAVQESFGYVPEAAVPLVARACNASRADAYGVLTFYADLRRTPPSAVEARICMGEACQAVGARALLRDAEAMVSADVDVTHVFCMGNCALGPTAVVNGRLIGRATADRVAGAIRAALEEAR